LRVYIFTDLEGVSGVTDFENRADKSCWNTYKRRFYSRLLTEEVNAAIRGCFDVGVKYVLVNDGHGSGYTIDPELIDPRAELLHGSSRPVSPLPLVEEEFDALLFVGAHSKARTRGGVLYHTMSTEVKEITINDVPLGEIGLAAFHAGSYGVPMIFLSGDEAACREARDLIPNIVTVTVKRGLSRFAAVSIPPVRARRLIENGVKESLKRKGEIKPFRMKPPYVYREYIFKAADRKALYSSNPKDLPKEYELAREVHADTAQDLIKKVYGRNV